LKNFLISTAFPEKISDKKTIVLIDDSVDLLELYKTILEMDNYDVLTAQSGKEALSLFSEITIPDLIICDLYLEDMLGTKFLEILEEERPDIMAESPVVFFTGHDNVPASKAVGHIKKPIDIDTFLKCVQDFIDPRPINRQQNKTNLKEQRG
jgi:DNA-binding NtrC family response regulator